MFNRSGQHILTGNTANDNFPSWRWICSGWGVGCGYPPSGYVMELVAHSCGLRGGRWMLLLRLYQSLGSLDDEHVRSWRKLQHSFVVCLSWLSLWSGYWQHLCLFYILSDPEIYLVSVIELCVSFLACIQLISLPFLSGIL